MSDTIRQLGLGLLVLLGCLQLPMVSGLDTAALGKVAEVCVKESGISPEEKKVLLADEMEKIDEKDFSHNMRCFQLCFYKQLGIIDANGDPIVEPFIKFMESRFTDKKDKVKPAIAKCRAITDADPCEHVFKFEVCMAHAIEGN
ncbi:uncharacterized protein LOC106088809 [Stomoxys calcitrans]|uniref:uncharacterized protein LOC106088809 n=1 Tax=Stomoxys calcitrans TaxID=35570 RepID=UPI0027E37EB1|nr:uncharacterized protein LOC106088809 [Stomoxys calcitrans]